LPVPGELAPAAPDGAEEDDDATGAGFVAAAVTIGAATAGFVTAEDLFRAKYRIPAIADAAISRAAIPAMIQAVRNRRAGGCG